MTKVVSVSRSADLIETGTEPEFFVTAIAKFETMADGLVRIYLATEKSGRLRLEYTAIVPAASLAEMGRACLHMAAEGHTRATFEQEARTH